MSFLEIKNLEKAYENHVALRDINLTIEKGRIFGLLGPNGAGKTSLIRIITQITAPDKGVVLFDGEKLKPVHTEKIGYLPEERGLYKKMKVGEQALYMAQLKGMSKKEALQSLRIWFKKFDILPWWDKKVEELSKGMQQKVQFITTILHQPPLLIFDEPFSGFDPINTNILKKEILEFKKQGATVIFSTHNMASVEEVCDDIALINQSQVILKGDMQDVKNSFKTNTYELLFDGDFDKIIMAQTPMYSINDISGINGHTRVSLTLAEGVETNQMLNHVLQAGKLVEFKEIILSMNDIFIRLVEEENAKIENNENK